MPANNVSSVYDRTDYDRTDYDRTDYDRINRNPYDRNLYDGYQIIILNGKQNK